MSDDQDFSTFGGFGGFGRRRQYFPPLPEDIYLHGENDASDKVPLILDGDERLLLKVVTRIYYKTLPKRIFQASINKLYDNPLDGVTRNVIGIDIVNVTGSGVTCTLYFSENDPPSSLEKFGICGGSVPANGLWSWRGNLYMETRHVWGQAGTANALYAYIAVASTENVYR